MRSLINHIEQFRKQTTLNLTVLAIVAVISFGLIQNTERKMVYLLLNPFAYTQIHLEQNNMALNR